uniref:Pepsin-I3 domain-containing protein n=1 Tax=Syphacia muris TaxID=451379 RepID=A0A0N5AUL7_9BILA
MIHSLSLEIYFFAETDVEINQLKGPTSIAYSGCPHAPKAERCETLLQGCSDRQRPHLPLTFTQYGYCSDFVLSRHALTLDEIIFESRFILNGVCVILNGTINKESLIGTATLDFDKASAALEEKRKRELKDHYGERIRALQQKFNLPYLDS